MRKNSVNKAAATSETAKPSPVGDTSKNAESKLKLLQHEEIIRQNENGLFMIGRSLAVIDDEGLYKLNGYKSFEIYCRERWYISDKHAYRLINASKCYDVLAAAKTDKEWILPKNEAQIRPLTKCKEHEQVAKWEQILETFSDRPFTAEDVEEFLFPDEVETGTQAGASTQAKASVKKAEARVAGKYKKKLDKIDEWVAKALEVKTNDDTIPIMKYRKFLEKIQKLIKDTK